MRYINHSIFNTTFIKLSFYFIFCIVLRLLESIFLILDDKSITLKSFLYGLNSDLLQVALQISILLPVIYILNLFIKKSNFITPLIIAIIGFIHTILVYFFTIKYTLFDASYLHFSINEYATFLPPEFSWNRFFIFILFLILWLSFIIYVLKFKYKFKSKFLNIFFILLYIISVYISFTNYHILCPNKNKFVKVEDYFISLNKFLYTVDSWVKLDKLQLIDNSMYFDSKITSKWEEDYKKNNTTLLFTDSEYPLKHKIVENSLGTFFTKSDTPPNLVFIFCESLSRCISGKDAIYGSFTPFIDSLAEQSLYWENFVSNAANSNGVMPAVLSSISQGGRHRFMNTLYQDPKINFNSIISILKPFDYYSSFYYPAWSGFDNMDFYLKKSTIDRIIDFSKFDTTKYNYPESTKDFYIWGYTDHNLFSQYFDFRKKASLSAKPFLDIFFTISMHSPYKDYTREYSKKELMNYGKSHGIKKFTILNTSKNDNIVLATLYFDLKLKEFFKEFSKDSKYNNTIFIITGDHNLRDLPYKSELDPYHVPLLIYSPQLLKAHRSKGVCAHTDILPSILSLLKNNYNLPLEMDYSFNGYGLDTSRSFSSKNIINLELYFGSHTNYIYKDFAVTPLGVKKIKDQLFTEEITNDKLRNDIFQKFENAKTMDKYISIRRKYCK